LCYAESVFETDDAWLALTEEEAVEPATSIVDAHYHLLGGPGEYGPQQFLDDIARSGHRVVASVYAESGQPYRTEGPEERRSVGETEWAAACAATLADLGGPPIVGIVAHADLRATDTLRDVLTEHAEVAGGLLRGIRQTASHDPTGSITVVAAGMAPAGLLDDEQLHAGVRTLGDLGLAFDTWIYYHQLDELARVAAAAPETTIVLDHVGGPVGVAAYKGRRDEILEEWRIGIAALAQRPNVVVKLGGIGMPLMGMRWHTAERPPTSDGVVAAWGDSVRFVIDRFGSERCMFESNFPVDRRSYGYGTFWNACKKMTADLSAAERTDLFSGTASRVYRLTVAATGG
jgi:L-fuconolactonase